MKQRPRIYYTETDKALMGDRWQKGESLNSIARLFDRHHSSIRPFDNKLGLNTAAGIMHCTLTYPCTHR